MTNYFGVAPGSYTPGNYPTNGVNYPNNLPPYNGTNTGSYPPGSGNYPIVAPPVQPGAALSAPAPGNIQNILLLLRLLDYYSYVRDLKDGYTLQSETRTMIDRGGESYAVLQLLGRINNDFAAQTMVCRLLGIVPVRPVSDTDFGNLLNLPLGRSDLKKAVGQAKKLEFGYFRDDVQDLLILLDLINNRQALESILPPDLKATFTAGQQQQYPSQQPTVDGTVQTIRQLFNTFNQYDRAYLASIFNITGEVSPKSLLEYALPIAGDDSDLTKAHCLVDPGSCPSEDKPAGEQTENEARRISFDGNVRLRFQDKDTPAYKKRADVLRYKAQVGINAQILPDWIKGRFSLITGPTDNPRSPNNSFSLELPAPRVDQAYLQFAPRSEYVEFSLTGGRIAHPLWLTANTVFDRDLVWDGLASNLLLKPDDNFSIFFNAGVLPLAAGTSSSSGSYLAPFQAGLDINTESFGLKAGFGYLDYYGINGAPVLAYRTSPDTNDQVLPPGAKTGDPNIYVHNYDAVIADGQISLKWQDGGSLHSLSLYGEFLKALNAPSGVNKSYTVGVLASLFDSRLTANYYYRRLEREATLSPFPDDDFNGGTTDVYGHTLILDGIYYKDKAFKAAAGLTILRASRINSNNDPAVAAVSPMTTVMVDFFKGAF